MSEYSIAQARNRFTRLVYEAESGKTIELTRRGKVVAVLIGRRQYGYLVTRPRRFSEAWDAFTREFDLRELKIDPDEVFAAVRDHAPRSEP